MNRSPKSKPFIDQIFRGDSRHMEQIPDGVVSLVVCSPPYNVQKPYSNHNDDMDPEDYKKMLYEVWLECKRVLRIGGRICVNVAGVWRQPYLPLHHIIGQQLRDLGFQMRGEIIWNKGSSAGVSTAWGSFASPSNPVLRDVHEYILIFSKEEFALQKANPAQEKAKLFDLANDSPQASCTITNDDFVEWTRSVWDMPTGSSINAGHPAPFPVDLPRRLILLYTYPEDIVLDPFLGAGTTCLAARITNRRYIGYDIDEGYVKKAKHRVRNAKKFISLQNDISTRRIGSQIGRNKNILKIETTASLVGLNKERRREVRIGIQDREIMIGIKTLGAPDIQKQSLTASLKAISAERLAIALLNRKHELSGIRPEMSRSRTTLTKRKGSEMSEDFTIEATALVGQEGEVRDREVSVSKQGREILLKIKTLGTPDIQKQNLTASLQATDAQRLSAALLRAAESITSQSEE